MSSALEVRGKKLGAPVAIGLRPMHIRPMAGQRIIVQMKDGRQLPCSCTMIYMADTKGIMIYYKRKSIDEMKAKGWWPI